MKHLTIQININDDDCIESVFTLENTTGKPSNHAFMQQIALALYISYKDNKESIEVQDLLSELNIDTEDTKDLK